MERGHDRGDGCAHGSSRAGTAVARVPLVQSDGGAAPAGVGRDPVPRMVVRPRSSGRPSRCVRPSCCGPQSWLGWSASWPCPSPAAELARPRAPESRALPRGARRPPDRAARPGRGDQRGDRDEPGVGDRRHEARERRGRPHRGRHRRARRIELGAASPARGRGRLSGRRGRARSTRCSASGPRSRPTTRPSSPHSPNSWNSGERRASRAPLHRAAAADWHSAEPTGPPAGVAAARPQPASERRRRSPCQRAARARAPTSSRVRQGLASPIALA